MSPAAPHPTTDRIESLDVLRGFALLGILLMNIVGFGLPASGYFDPRVGLGDHPALNLATWSVMSVSVEGAMRALFSMLFGAGVVLFTTGFGTAAAGKGAWLHYKRNFWLLAFGLFDAYVLLWAGDILLVYAVAGALLYPLRRLSPRTLMLLAALVMIVTSGVYGATHYFLSTAHDAAVRLATESGAEPSPELRQLAGIWHEMEADLAPGAAQHAEEIAARTGSYWEAFRDNLVTMRETLLFVGPVYLLWDALAMMLLGMALYRQGVLSAERSKRYYLWLMVIGFGVGLTVNGWELSRSIADDFHLLSTFVYFQPSYHLGRLGMALGWLALVMLICKSGLWTAARRRLAAVGRMALTNYLMHSLIALFLFTGAGLGLLGALERWALYPIVAAIWLVQLSLSPWWLRRHRFGPAEWLWRRLTYASRPGAGRESEPGGLGVQRPRP